mmetsp:Transcript_176384/g.565547  ORF Transcript_176384/g.565547 Transcript_176384/m.565547 type:complete len:209 (-) Transcript_176384:2160-2786(-)
MPPSWPARWTRGGASRFRCGGRTWSFGAASGIRSLGSCAQTGACSRLMPSPFPCWTTRPSVSPSPVGVGPWSAPGTSKRRTSCFSLPMPAFRRLAPPSSATRPVHVHASPSCLGERRMSAHVLRRKRTDGFSSRTGACSRPMILLRWPRSTSSPPAWLWWLGARTCTGRSMSDTCSGSRASCSAISARCSNGKGGRTRICRMQTQASS